VVAVVASAGSTATGAFDPLDENRLKRVRADGVVKKPKPTDSPDPLIAMVKSALAKAAKARPAQVPEMREAADAFAAAVPKLEETQKLAPEELARLTGEKLPEPAPQPEAEIYPARPERIEFKEEEKPLAFGELLDVGVAEPKAEPAAPAFKAPSVAGMEIEQTPAAVEAPPAAEPEVPSWGGIQPEPRQPAPDEPPIKVEFGPAPPAELVTEEPAAAPILAAEPLRELVSSAVEWPEPAATAPPPTVAEPEVAAPAYPFELPPPPVPPEPAPAAGEAFEAAVMEPAAPPGVEAFPEVTPATELPPAEEPVVAPSGVPSEELPGLTWSEAAVSPAELPPPQAPVEPISAAPAVSFAIPQLVDPALVEAVVEKILARLEPQTIEKMTREILRPLAEGLLRRELEK
jgi:hypothetical protein